VRTFGSGLLQAFLVKYGDMPDLDAKEKEKEKSPDKRTHKKKKKDAK
jgi:hypothetical protein